MIPGRIDGANVRMLGTTERMGDLQVRRLQYQDGHVGLTSVWFPNEEEIADIVAGRPIYLHVLGRGHPPVKLATKDEFR